MSPGLAAGISILVTLVVGLVVVLLVMKWYKRKRSGSRETLLRSVDRYQNIGPGVMEGAQ